MKLLPLSAAMIAALSIAPTYADIEQSNNKVAKHLTTITNAQSIKRIPPKYPEKEQRKGNEGWVKSSFVIEKDGTVSNIIVEDSSSKGFEKEAIRALKRWKFTPAYENGQPIQQCQNSVQLDFKMAGAKGVNRKFYKKYKEIETAIKNNKIEDADKLLIELGQIKQRRHAENQYLSLINVEYANKIGDKKRELKYLARLSTGKSSILTDKSKLPLLNQRLTIQLGLNKFSRALATLNSITQLKTSEEMLAKFTQIKTQIENLIDSDQDISVIGNTKQNDFWHHTLVRNNFSLSNITGELQKLDVRCANKRHVFTVEENNTWNIPTNWKNCSIYVYGDNNVSFNLTEHHSILASETASL